MADSSGHHGALGVVIFGIVLLGIFILLFAVQYKDINLFENLKDYTTLKDLYKNSTGAGTTTIPAKITVGTTVVDVTITILSTAMGPIPTKASDTYSNVPAMIIMIGVFLILVITFGDMLATYSLFSSRWVGWTVGIILAIVAANLKIGMIIAVYSMGIAGGVGVIAAASGIIIPFVAFIYANFFLFPYIKANHAKIITERGIRRIRAGARGLAAVGEEEEEAGKTP